MLSRQECLDLAVRNEEAAARAVSDTDRERYRKFAEDWRRLADESPDARQDEVLS